MRKFIVSAIFLILSAYGAGAQGSVSLPKAPEFAVDSLAPNLVSYVVRNPFPDSRARIALAASADGVHCQYLAKADSTFKGVLRDSTLTQLLRDISAVQGRRAIIICGDIDTRRTVDSLKAVARRMLQTDSLMLPRISCIRKPGNCEIVLTAQGLPQTDRGTVVERVTERYSHWLGAEFVRRCNTALRESGIPCGGAGYSYQRGNDETMIFQASVEERDQDRAMQVMRLCLLSIADGGFRHWPPADYPVENHADPMERCLNAFFFGRDLASDATVQDYFVKHPLPKVREQEFFRAFAEEYVSCLRPAASQNDPSWRGRIDHICQTPVMADSVRLNLPVSKVKLRNTTKDSITGGEIWTFSNGMNVLYRQIPSDGRMEYALCLAGSGMELEHLSAGEIALVGDMLGISRLGGLDGPHFKDILQACGMTMEIETGVSGTVIRGHADNGRLDLILKAMYAISSARRPATAAELEDYRKSLALRDRDLRQSIEGIEAAMDSLLCPDFAYASVRKVHTLRDDLPQRAERLFASSFRRFDENLLILAGDMSADRVKRLLSRHLGLFETGGTRAMRASASWVPRSGCLLVRRLDGAVVDSGSVHLTMGAPLGYSRQRQMILQVAEGILQDMLDSSLHGSGYRAKVVARLEIQPVERMIVHIHCNPVPGVELQMDKYAVLDAVRKVLNSAPSLKEGPLDGCREVLTAQFKAAQSDASALVDAAIARYSLGKDIMGSAAQIKSFKWTDVMSLLAEIRDMAQVELIAD